MKRRWVVLPMLWLASACTGEGVTGGAGGAGGSGGVGGGAGQAGGGGQAEGCVDIRVEMSLFPVDLDLLQAGSPLRNSAWLDGGTLLLGSNYVADEVDHRTSLAVTPIDLAAGSVGVPRLYEPIPVGVKGGASDIFTVGGAPGGSFIVGYGYVDPLLPAYPFGTMFYAAGSLGEPGVLTPLSQVFPDEFIPSRIRWDGGALALHAEGGLGTSSEAHYARVTPDGTVLVPNTMYGWGNNVNGPMGSRLAFDPSTLITWLADLDQGRVFAAHTLDGTSLHDGTKVIPPAETAPATGGDIAPNGSGIDLVWAEKDGFDGAAGRLTPGGVLVDDFVFPPPCTTERLRSFGLLHREDGGTTAIGVYWDGACLFDIDYENQTVSEGALFFDNTGAVDLTRLDHKFFFEHPTGRWLGFWEPTGGALVWRVIRLAPGCVYPSWRLLQEQGG